MTKTGYLIAGLAFFIIPLFWLPRVFKEQLVEKKGELVNVKIVEMPINCITGRRQKLYFSFEYKEVTHSKQLGITLCEKYKIGDIIKLRHIDTLPDIFLFPQESIISDLIASILLSCFGLYVLIKYSAIGNRIKLK